MADSKKHHYVPQSILRNFSIDGENKQIFVFDEQSEKSYSSSIINAGSENQYNTIQGGSEELNLESLFQELDNIYSDITKKIIRLGSYKGLDKDDFYYIALITAHQLKRSKMVRSTIKYMDNELKRNLDDVRLKLKLEESGRSLNTEEVKGLSILASFDLEEEIFALLTKGMYLIKNTGNVPFITSDCPVVLHNGFPYAGNGLFDKGIEVYFPISPKYIIAFCCKTLMSRLELSEKIGNSIPEARNLLLSINEDSPYELDNQEFIEFYNQQQILNCHRFIYSSVNDFSLARETILHMPESKSRESTVKLGEMGKMPKNTNLPMGDLMVIYAAVDHGMFPIQYISHSDAGIIFKCENSYSLEMILKDVPFQRVEFYSDQTMRRMMGKSEIVIIDKSNNLYEACFQDKSMNKLFEAYRKAKNE